MTNDRPSPRPARLWRGLLIAVVILAAGYVGAWFLTAHLIEQQTAQFIDAQRSGGIVVTTGAMEASGFPGRVHVAIPDIAVVAPIAGGGWTWQTKGIGLAAWPLVWWIVDADFGGTHRTAGMVTHLNMPVWISAAQAHGHFELDMAGRLQHVLLSAENATVALSEGGEAWARAGSLRADAQLVDVPGSSTPQGANATPRATARLELETRDLAPPKGLPLHTTAPLTRASLTAEITGQWPAGPLPTVLEAWRAGGGTLEVRDAALDWAPIHISGSGTLALDRSLQPMGSLSLRLQGGEDVLELLINQGVVNETQGSIARAGIALLSRHNAAGVPELNVPLTLQDRTISAGPFTVGQIQEIGWPRIVVP